ncbi:hypothetical protein H4582DRAFT_726434 [Lactarius indigo]|nr:hypothetical protein H4582DRAFT_726434 [Lactarius indigo]
MSCHVMSPVVVQQESPPQNVKWGDTVTPEATYCDSSRTIFSIYITYSQKLDEDNVENWKAVADRILVFTGLFSATVAIFIAISYPNLRQDPNIITQSLLAQISQQLSDATLNGASGVSNTSTPSFYIPPASVVFINLVWFLSLVLSLMSALLATFLQQWARRYLHAVRQNHAPHVQAHIREYFSRGAHKFYIFGLVEALPFLLLVSIHLFFAGLVAFAFRANHTVAYFTTAIVGFCVLSYIALTLMPLIFHDCPYYTPLTSVLWYAGQIIPLSYFSVLYHCAREWYGRWGTGGEKVVKSLRDRYKNSAKSFSEGIISKLENSAKRVSVDIYSETLVRTLNWLTEDRELEEFITGIPDLCESKALATHDNGDTQRTIRDVLAALPGPMNFHTSLPWSLVQLSQRAITSKLPKSVQQRRTRACLKALYYIPGAIRDILAPYAAEKSHSSEILPLLDSPESLEIINELQNTPNVDITVAIPIRCVAAVVAAHMITSPLSTFDVFFIGDHNFGKQFLNERLGVDAYMEGADGARLRNIARFLEDIKDTLGELNKQWWASSNAELIRKQRKQLFTARRDLTQRHHTGDGMFHQQGDRASPAFVPAAQQDLITLTLEILARDPVAGSAKPQWEAFRVAYEEFEKVAFIQAKKQAMEQHLGQPLAETRVLSESDQEALAWIENQAGDSIEMAKRALGSVMQSRRPQIIDTLAASTVRPDDAPDPAPPRSAQKSLPLPVSIPSLPYSVSSSSAWPGNSPV